MIHARESCQSDAERQFRVLESVSRSLLFRNYQSAFEEATGLALHLASIEGALLDEHCMRHYNAFCGQLHSRNTVCEECRRMWRKMVVLGDYTVRHFNCFAGFCESCVPIRIGTKAIGLLIAGEVATSPPSQAKFDCIIARLKHDGHAFDKAKLKRVYFSTPASTRRQYDAAINLLETFAAHLSWVTNQIVLHESDSADPAIRKARKYIHAHLAEPLGLKEVARRANLSGCYFSTKFKDLTGLAFTEYVARARVEAAKKLLAIPGIRVSEIAFAVGFQSLTHFNRTFKNMTCCSPTRFRENCVESPPEQDPPISKNPSNYSKNPVSHHPANAAC